ncbi:MAG: hypothetical protein II265_01485, partial [Clostridia bacterium]|nr:hypothetical protein [Clostridia bacterium]
MTTFGVMCCKCSTKTAVTSDEPPNFCAICGSKEIVLQGEVPVDRQDEQPVRAQLTKALNPFRDGVAILEGSSPSVGGFGSVLAEQVSSSDSEKDVSLDKKLAD